MKATGFETKLLQKISKLNADQIQQFLEQIVEQKQFLVGVLDRLNEGVIVTNGELEVLFANPKARSMLGLGRPRGQQPERLKELLSGETPLGELMLSLGGNLREIDGYEAPYGRQSERYAAVTTLLMRSMRSLAEPVPLVGMVEPSEPTLIVLLQDVTERRLRLEEQARARRLASMATLTSGIAHEIKNPLNSLNIHAQLLREESERAAGGGRPANPERLERATAVILEETQRLSRVVDDFMRAARPRHAELREQSLEAFLGRASEVFGPECRQGGVTLIVNVEPDLPPLEFDDHLLMQALRNLVRNAIEALGEYAEAAREERPGWSPTLELAAATSGEVVNLTVADNGPGIDPATLEHIFEPYYTTKFQGTGLGLMVVYRIVTEHKGALHVDTKPGEGTRFEIALPMHQKPTRLLERGRDRQALEAGPGGANEE